MEKKSVIISSNIGVIVGLFLLSNAIAVPSASAFDNCVDVDCLKGKPRLICKTEPKPEYLDCENILRCIDGGEQEVMKCAMGYPAGI
jgi:hypothetical protein